MLRIFRRSISTSNILRQQQFYNQYRPAYNQDQEVVGGEEGDAPEVQSKFKSFRSTTTTTPLKPVEPTLPFPEESNQDYGQPLANSSSAFSTEVRHILMEPISDQDIEIKPDGILYLPEIRYRKILLKAFGPGGWCLVPKGPHNLTGNVLSREYALFCNGKYISQARGSSVVQSFSNSGASSEAVRSNALMRCCKDLGVASELWDPEFISKWRAQMASKKMDSRGKPYWVKNN